jgi:hypothetical protein
MLVKFFNRGTGGSAGVMNYMLGRKRDRAGATLLRGNVKQTADLIDSLTFRKKYTSGCLSFEETEIKPELKASIMDGFEHAIFAGLDRDQYDVTWIEHTDKNGRIELNFVIPNVELLTGRRLQPYYDPADRTRINAWQNLVNAHFNFADPHDPARRKALTKASDLPKPKQEAAQAITNGLTALIAQGIVKDRQNIIQALTEAGFNVTRETRQSISVTLPGEAKPLRLSGGIYERDFKTSGAVSAELTAAYEAYSRDRTQRADAAREIYKETYRAKQNYNRGRYERPRQSDTASIKQSAIENSDSIHNRANQRLSNSNPDLVRSKEIRSFLNDRANITTTISCCIAAAIEATRQAITERFRASAELVKPSNRTDRYKKIRLTEQQPKRSQQATVKVDVSSEATQPQRPMFRM